MAEYDNTDNPQSASDADIAKVQEYIKGQVQTYLTELQEQQASTQPQHQQGYIDPQEQQRRQVGELIDPFIKPSLDEARFVAADAKDYVSFYTGNPDAVEYQDRVEATFLALKKANRPTSRSDILDYLRGQEYRVDRDSFVQKATAKQKAQLERAEGAVDVGQGSLTRARSDPVWSNFDKLSSEEQEKHLDGVTF